MQVAIHAVTQLLAHPVSDGLQRFRPGQAHLEDTLRSWSTFGIPVGHRIEFRVGVIRQILHILNSLELNESCLGRAGYNPSTRTHEKHS
jgi:hypothetical protein